MGRKPARPAGATKSPFPWLLVAPFLALSILWQAHLIGATSPTFDEPSYLFSGIYHEQTGEWYVAHEHPPLLFWILGKAHGLLGNFKNAADFSRDPAQFTNQFQYRMDAFSGLPSDETIERARALAEAFFLIAWGSLLWIAWRSGIGPWGLAALAAFAALEPAWVGLFATVNSDTASFAWLALATAFCLGGRRWHDAAALFFFSLAWATKFTSAFWALPLAIGIVLGRLPRKAAALWIGGAIGGFAIAEAIGLPAPSSALMRPNYRLSYLDGLMTPYPQLQYFLQAVLCKSSLAALSLFGFAAYSCWKGGSRRKLAWALGLVLSCLLAQTQLVPGIGVRFTITAVFTAILLACSQVRTRRAAAALVALLALEAALSFDGALSYQNALAGSEPRLLDSNADWGQGLKELAAWRKTHNDAPIALALFGGAPPELYGLDDYRSLPSFPELRKGKALESGRFSGYAAVSRNFLYGYAVDSPSLRVLKSMTPLTCFQDALCLYDVRDSR